MTKRHFRLQVIILHEADWDEFQDQNLTVKVGQAYPPRFHDEFIIRKLNPFVVVDFRFISAFLMSREVTREAVTKFLPAKFP